MCVASRPSVWPSASTSNQRRSMSPARAEYVFMQTLPNVSDDRSRGIETRLRGGRCHDRPSKLSPRNAGRYHAARGAVKISPGRRAPNAVLDPSGPARCLPELPEHQPQAVERLADQVVVVALDPAHEHGSLSLDPVDPRLVQRL